MRARVLLLPAVLVLLAVSQTSLLSRVQVLQVKPDLLVIAVVGWGMTLGFRQGLLSGLLAGLLLDLFSVTPFGAHVLALLPVAALAGLREVRVMESELLLVLVAVFFGTLLYGATLLMILQVTGEIGPWGSTLRWVLLPSAVVNTFLTPPAYWVLRSLARWVQMPEPAAS